MGKLYVQFKAPGFDILKYFKLFLKVHTQTQTHIHTHYNSMIKCLSINNTVRWITTYKNKRQWES